MKKILCYGDSNTFGYRADNGLRYDEKTRWTSILQSKSKSEYKIIEEGMCDRTGFADNPKGVLFSAQKHFPKLVSEIENMDVLILAIGTNDLQFLYKIEHDDIEKGLERLLTIAKEKFENIILVPPVVLSENILDGYFNCQFDKTSIAKSKTVGKIYKNLADKYGCRIFDINEFTKPSDKDGLHYDETSHELIARNLAEFLKQTV